MPPPSQTKASLLALPKSFKTVPLALRKVSYLVCQKHMSQVTQWKWNGKIWIRSRKEGEKGGAGKLPPHVSEGLPIFYFSTNHCTTAPSSHLAYKWDSWIDCVELLLRHKLPVWHKSNFLNIKMCLFMVLAFRTNPALHQYQLPPQHLSSNLSCQKYCDNCCLTSVTLLLVFASRKKKIFNFDFKTNKICSSALTCCLAVSRRQIFVVIWKAHRKQIYRESISMPNTLLFAIMKGWWICFFVGF